MLGIFVTDIVRTICLTMQYPLNNKKKMLKKNKTNTESETILLYFTFPVEETLSKIAFIRLPTYFSRTYLLTICHQ